MKAEELQGIEDGKDPSEFFSSPVLQHHRSSATFRHEPWVSAFV